MMQGMDLGSIAHVAGGSPKMDCLWQLKVPPEWPDMQAYVMITNTTLDGGSVEIKGPI